jgi:sucrose-phosphate synthase
MHIAFLNPQGNFDPQDSYWTEHADFGGQLVYVKQVALAMAEHGHQVDILTRQIIDPEWPEFAEPEDSYPESSAVRIIRLPAGPHAFLRKELLWPHLVNDWVPKILAFYSHEGKYPDAFTAHYGDGGLCGALINDSTGIPFTFTAHSLGAQKMDKMNIQRSNLTKVDEHYHFGRRLIAERLSMNRSCVNITSTQQERYSQYSHNAYRGAVDWTSDASFAIIPPGVNLDIFDRAASYHKEQAVHDHIQSMLERDIAADRLDLPCIIASSRLDPKKNHIGLVEAFSYSPELRNQANLVIITGNLENPLQSYLDAGETEQAVLKQMMEIIQQNQLEGQISIFALRGQGQLAAGYRYFAMRKSIFTLTALYEPFGLAPLEAMASGLPAVVTKFGGPSESMRTADEEFGLLVDPSDPNETSAAYYSLIANSERWGKYSQAGYQRVLTRYTWERTASSYINRIQEAIAKTDAQRPETPLELHPYFRSPNENNDIRVSDLDELYFQIDVLAVGETLVDFISQREANSLRTADQYTRYLGGQPTNVAVNVALLGARSAVLSKIGEDRFGEFLEEQLQNLGVNTEHILYTDELPTTNTFLTKTTGVPDSQLNRGADRLLNIKDVQEDLIDRARVIHTSCFALSGEPSRSAIRRALRLAHRQGKLVTLDPNYNTRDWPDKDEAWEVLAQIMPYITIVKPSLEDARHLFDPNMDEAELQAACLHHFHDLGAKVVVITRSGGIVTVSDGNRVEHIGPFKKVPVESVIGGSDAFWAGLLVAHLDGKSWPFSVTFAHEIAAMKLGVVGHIDHLIDRQAIYQQIKPNSVSA